MSHIGRIPAEDEEAVIAGSMLMIYYFSASSKLQCSGN